MTGALDLDDTRRRNPRGDVLSDVDRNNLVLRPIEHLGRHPNRRQHVPNVDLAIHPVELLERAGTRAEPKHLPELLDFLGLENAERADRFA